MIQAVSRHAAQRYQERVKPSLTLKQARAEMKALAQQAREIPRPGWTTMTSPARYIELTPDVIIPTTQSGVALTVLRRPSPRERKRLRRANRRTNTSSTESGMNIPLAQTQG